jgi:hypothetical protein
MGTPYFVWDEDGGHYEYDDTFDPYDYNQPYNPGTFTPGGIGTIGGNVIDTDRDPYSGEQPYNPGTYSPGAAGTLGGSNAITSAINKLFNSNLSTKQLLAMAGVAGGGLAGLMSRGPAAKVGYQGGIPKYEALRNMTLAPQAGSRPGAGGTRYGGDVSYAPKTAPQVQVIPAATEEVRAAHGGLMGLAKGKYLQGDTDGMADEIPAKIGKDQPAALSHGEFVIPADVVSHLGNGNSDAGAKKLYSMMDKIREARTGSKKQGKQINPDKFMPGGLAYAAGGKVQGFAVGGTPTGSAVAAGVTGTEQAPASWAGEYITDMLGKGQALANAPYQEYGGPLTAGASNLQNQAFQNAGNLSVPGSVGAAAQTAGDIAAKAQGLNYSPTAFSNQFNAPAAYTPSSAPQYNQLNAGNVSSTYQAPTQYQASGLPQYNQLGANTVSSTFQAPAAYQTGTFGNAFQAPTQTEATNFTNQFTAPGQYQNTNFTSGTFGGEQAQQYMNPYLQASLNPQLAEARRQADITEQANKAAMTKAGAYGGGRSAILAAENQRNLGTNLANITGKGYDTAFQNAMSQFNADQARNMQAQQASEQSKQFGASQSMTAADMMAKYGMSAQQAQEAARQFNQQQALTAAQSAAQYGLAGQQATEASRQFGANQALQGATTAGAQGLQAALANQQAGLTAGQANINAAMEAARQAEASRQFGYGQSTQQAQTAAQLGLQAQQANQSAGLTAGQGNINAALEAARQAEASRQFGASQGMTAAQQAAQYGQAAQAAAEQSRQFGATQGLAGLNTALQAANAQGNLGISSADLGLRNLQSQLAAGATQRGIESEGIAADKAAFEAARDNPYKMLQFQQSLLNGLPITAQNYDLQQPDALTRIAGGATTTNKLLETLGLISPQTPPPAK